MRTRNRSSVGWCFCLRRRRHGQHLVDVDQDGRVQMLEKCASPENSSQFPQSKVAFHHLHGSCSVQSSGGSKIFPRQSGFADAKPFRERQTSKAHANPMDFHDAQANRPSFFFKIRGKGEKMTRRTYIYGNRHEWQ
jgi:hypothetical protein